MAEHVRASDQERDDASRALREHFAAGRIDQDDLDQRLARVYGATTTAELHALFADLPLLPQTAAELRAEHVARRAHLQRRLLQQTGGGIVPFVICTVIWIADGASGSFWPIWIALFAIIPLLRGAWALYGPAPDLDRYERELETRDRSARHAERQARRAGRGSRLGPPRG